MRVLAAFKNYLIGKAIRCQATQSLFLMSHSIRARITKWVNAPLQLAVFPAWLYVRLMNWKFQLILSEEVLSSVWSVPLMSPSEGQSDVGQCPSPSLPSCNPFSYSHPFSWTEPSFMKAALSETGWWLLTKSFNSSHQVKATVQSRIPGTELAVLEASDIAELLP